MSIMRMTKANAEEYYEELKNSKFRYDESIPDRYLELRKILRTKYLDVFNKYSKTNNRNKDYLLDFYFGLEVYEIMNNEFNLTRNLPVSANISFWIYLQMKVVPDIVYSRWQDRPLRFYKQTNRVWLSSIWWYIHLAWQGSKEQTAIVAHNFTTDTIVNLIERTYTGYDVNLTREIIRQLKRYDNKNQRFFRSIMVLNTIYLKTIEPKFYKNSYEGYVKMLFEKASNK